MAESLQAADPRLKARSAGLNEDSKYCDPFIIVLIILNLIAVMLETVQSLNARFGTLFHIFDAFSVAVFTVEYLLCAWSCTVDPRYKRP